MGLFGPWMTGVSGGDRYLYAMAQAISKSDEVDIVTLFPLDVAAAAAGLGYDLSRVRVRSIHPRPGRLWNRLSSNYDLHLYRDLYVAAGAVRVSRGYDLFFAQHFMSLSPARARRNVLICQFPQERLAWTHYRTRPQFWLYLLIRYGVLRPELGSYQEIVCYSEYVRRWIKRRYNAESTVLYPPVELPAAPEGPRDRVILSVARFFSEGYNKGHPALIEGFRRLVARGLRGWELHLAGSRHHLPRDVAYYDSLVAAAAGLPVVFHPDLPQAELEALQRRAAIFWHAAGAGIDLDRHPQWAEHFGISTVEAMANGAVPVVLNAGGQAEIVRDGHDGFTWNGIDDLVARTLEVASDEALRQRLASAARVRALDFSPEAFAGRVRDLVDRMRP